MHSNFFLGSSPRAMLTIAAAALAIVASASAQQPAVPGGAGVPGNSAAPGVASTKSAGVQAPSSKQFTEAELDNLLGPIALYPDNLLANVLAASVYPAEVKEAGAFVAGGGSAEAIEGKSWEPPVKAVAAIPDVIKMMNEYPDWTVAIGQAYLTQGKDVLQIVQTLRKKAQANGALQTTQEQTVAVRENIVYITPTDPQIIYVPTYSPSVVYVSNPTYPVAAGAIGFGLGITAGLLLSDMDCYWGRGCVGWGYGHHGNYGNTNVKINGDVNIGRNNNDVNIGNGDRNRVNNGVVGGENGRFAGNANRAGNEGNAFAPNRGKELATKQPSRASEFRGAGANNAIPGAGNGGRNPGANAGAGAAGARIPGAAGAGGAGAAGGPNPGAAGAGGAATRPVNTPARTGNIATPPRTSPSMNGSGARGSSPARSPSSAGSGSAGARQNSASAFNGGRQSQASSQRGQQSRSGGSRSSGGRSGGGGRR